MNRIVVLGDLGGPAAFHAGDEAMAFSLVAELRQRIDCAVTAISGDPDVTRARYGWDAIGRIGFSSQSTRAQWEARLSAVEAAARGSAEALEWDDPAWDVISAVAASDAVLIAGGGNLNSGWTGHIYERAALAAIARVLGRPLVVSGQSVGPLLGERDGELVASVLTTAEAVSVREAESATVALSLGVPPRKIHHTQDDAASSWARASHVPDPLPKRFVAATFAPWPGMVDASLYEEILIKAVAVVRDLTSLPVVLIPNQVGVGGAQGDDLALHERIAAALPRVTSRSFEPGAESVIASRASLVLSTRYHPAVWALAAGVPSVSLSVDKYTSTKIAGAYRNYGVDEWAMPCLATHTGHFERSVAYLWQERQAVASHLEARGKVLAAQHASWFDHVAAIVTGSDRPAVDRFPDAVAFEESADAEAIRWLREWSDQVTGSAAESLLEAQLPIEHVGVLESEKRALADELSASRVETDRMADALEALRASGLATQRLLSRRIARAAAGQDREADGAHPEDAAARDAELIERQGHEIEALQAELLALHATKTFRFSRAPRVIYRRVRRRSE